MSSRQAADPAANNHQIIALASLGGCAVGVPRFAIAETVSVGEASIMVAAHAGQGWRIVAWSFLRREFRAHPGMQKRVCGQQAAYTDRHSIQKVSAGDITVHA